MKTKPALHPWVTTSACHILNPPKQFRFRDAVRIGKIVLKWGIKVGAFLIAFAAIYVSVWILFAVA